MTTQQQPTVKRYTKVRTVTAQGAQGDILLTRVDAIPSNAKPRTPSPEARILAHSETGHHHVLDAQDARIFDGPQSGLVCFLSVGEGTYADIVHLRDYDTHVTLRLPAGNWRMDRQEEPTPEGWRVVAD